MIRHAIVAAEIGEFGARVLCVCGAAITRAGIGGADRRAMPWGGAPCYLARRGATGGAGSPARENEIQRGSAAVSTVRPISRPPM